MNISICMKGVETMKKSILLFISLLCVLAMVGCGQKATISGSFTAQVRGVIPDYVVDEKPRIAIVTEFQGFPFLLHVGPEIGKQLVEGEIYVFTIEPVSVDFSKEDLKGASLFMLAKELPGFVITDFRLANEDEIGLDSLYPTIE